MLSLFSQLRAPLTVVLILIMEVDSRSHGPYIHVSELLSKIIARLVESI